MFINHTKHSNTNSNNKEKIYHLPFDQQYDKLAMSKESGRLYLSSAAEAEQQGFRRAYRWKGSGGVV